MTRTLLQLAWHKLAACGNQAAFDLLSTDVTALCEVASFGFTKILDVLTRNREASELNAVDQRGRTALMYAALHGHSDCV